MVLESPNSSNINASLWYSTANVQILTRWHFLSVVSIPHPNKGFHTTTGYFCRFNYCSIWQKRGTLVFALTQHHISGTDVHITYHVLLSSVYSYKMTHFSHIPKEKCPCSCSMLHKPFNLLGTWHCFPSIRVCVHMPRPLPFFGFGFWVVFFPFNLSVLVRIELMQITDTFIFSLLSIGCKTCNYTLHNF